MKKIISSITLLAAIITASAESKTEFGVEIRNRMAIGSIGTSTDSKAQYFNRYTDFRLRPSFKYTISDQVSGTAILNAGDYLFGSNPAIGAAPVVTIKEMYLEIKPGENHNIKIGQQAYADAHSIILDGDLPGAVYSGSFGSFSLSAGWFAESDLGERNVNEKSFSFGKSLLMLNPAYQISETMQADLLLFSQLGSDSLLVNSEIDKVSGNHFNIWLAPRFSGTFGIISADIMAVYNRNSYYFDRIKGGNSADYSDDTAESKSGNGFAASIKIKAAINDRLTVGVNLLTATGDDAADSKSTDGYSGISGAVCYASDLQILTQSGIEDQNHLGDNLFTDKGVLLPSVHANYAVNDKFSLGAGAGIGMTLEDVFYQNKQNAADPLNGKKETLLGIEFNLNSTITAYENLTISPFAALFIPGKGYAYSQTSDKTDAQMKIGATLTAGF